MSRFAKCRVLLPLVAAGLGLSACGGDMDDLDAYINEVKARPGGRIEPLPEDDSGGGSSELIRDPVCKPIYASSQRYDAVAVPSEDEGFTGLHPNDTFGELPVKVGAVTSSVHVTVLDVVAEFPQPSVAVNVLVIDRPHPVL